MLRRRTGPSAPTRPRARRRRCAAGLAALAGLGVVGCTSESDAEVDLRAEDGPEDAEWTLPDGRVAVVSAGEVVVRDDVRVWLSAVEGDAGTRQAVLVEADAPALALGDLGGGDPILADGVGLLARTFNLPYERGELAYAEAPRTTAVELGPTAPAAVAWLDPEVTEVCVEVLDVDQRFAEVEDPRPGRLAVVDEFRSSEGTLQLACSEAQGESGVATVRSLAAATVGLAVPDPVADTSAAVGSDVTWSRGGDESEVRARFHLRGPVTLRLPEDAATFGVAFGRGTWLPPAAGGVELVLDPETDTEPVEVVLSSGALHDGFVPVATEAELCFEVTVADAPTELVCSPITNW